MCVVCVHPMEGGYIYLRRHVFNAFPAHCLLSFFVALPAALAICNGVARRRTWTIDLPASQRAMPKFLRQVRLSAARFEPMVAAEAFQVPPRGHRLCKSFVEPLPTGTLAQLQGVLMCCNTVLRSCIILFAFAYNLRP